MGRVCSIDPDHPCAWVISSCEIDPIIKSKNNKDYLLAVESGEEGLFGVLLLARDGGFTPLSGLGDSPANLLSRL